MPSRLSSSPCPPQGPGSWQGLLEAGLELRQRVEGLREIMQGCSRGVAEVPNLFGHQVKVISWGEQQGSYGHSNTLEEMLSKRPTNLTLRCDTSGDRRETKKLCAGTSSAVCTPRPVASQTGWVKNHKTCVSQAVIAPARGSETAKRARTMRHRTRRRRARQGV